MLPTVAWNGQHLAEILPACLRSVGVETAFEPAYTSAKPIRFPDVDTVVLLVVDGLGAENLRARSSYARFLSEQPGKTITTTAPTTTASALSTLTTGVLPGEHGLLGYSILDPEAGRVRNALRDWDDLPDLRRWQRARSQFEFATDAGASCAVIARSAHQHSGLTRAILTGAHYVPAQTMAERFRAAEQLIRAGETNIIYLYVDELDRCAHHSGWQSAHWERLLEDLDAEVRRFVTALPARVGVALVADHGIVDAPKDRQLLFDEHPELSEDVAVVAGEPRFRHLYMAIDTDLCDQSRVDAARSVAKRWQDWLGSAAEVCLRQEAIDKAWFGPVGADVAPRIGDVLVAMRSDWVLYSAGAADAGARSMIGQHGSLSPAERQVPLIRMGAFA